MNEPPPGWTPTTLEPIVLWHAIERKLPELARAVLPRLFEPHSSYHHTKEIAACLAANVMQVARDVEMGVSSEKEISYLTVANLIRDEMPTYFVSPTLLAAAVATSIPPTLQLSALKWPMEAMLFILPKGGLKLSSGGEIRFLAFSRHNPGPGQPALPDFPATTGVVFESVSFLAGATTGIESSSLLDLKDSALAQWTEMELPSLSGAYVPAGSENFGRFTRQVTMKLILALCARPAFIQASRKSRNASKKKGRAKSELWAPNILGREYRPREETGTEARSGSGTSKRLHWVRGHFRQQPYGPRDNPHYETIWIEPFLSGTA